MLSPHAGFNCIFKALLIPFPVFSFALCPTLAITFLGLMYFCKAHALAISGTFRKLGAVLLSSLLFTVFTVEYRHLVDESFEHLLGHHQNSADSSRGNPTHRCHNCVTSQPQGETVRWDYQPTSWLALFTL